MKLNDSFGENFPLEAKMIEAKSRHMEATFRGFVSLGILASTATALSIATCVGLSDGTFNEVNGVWNAAASVVGAVVGHYLGRKNE